jgi:hypothetical protein
MFIPGIVVFALGVTLQAGLTDMTALTAGQRPPGASAILQLR